MSHAATNWAIQQSRLKPANKIVLWFLCDRHNPDFGCFPTQARLAEDAEMSISALNEHLATLEDLGLIHRIRAHDPRSHRRLPTRYILGFEQGFSQKPTPESADGAISGFPACPSPDFAQSHLRNPEYNLVRQPLTKPVKEAEDAREREIDFDHFFAERLTAPGLDPNGTLPAWWQGWPARTHVRRWRDDLGMTEDRIIETATETRRDHPAPPDGPKALDRAMERATKRDVQSAAASAKPSTRQTADRPHCRGTPPQR